MKAYEADTAGSSISDALYEIGTVSLCNGATNQALKWYHQSLEMKKRIYGDDADRPNISITMHQLGSKG